MLEYSANPVFEYTYSQIAKHIHTYLPRYPKQRASSKKKLNTVNWVGTYNVKVVFAENKWTKKNSIS